MGEVAFIAVNILGVVGFALLWVIAVVAAHDIERRDR